MCFDCYFSSFDVSYLKISFFKIGLKSVSAAMTRCLHQEHCLCFHDVVVCVVTELKLSCALV